MQAGISAGVNNAFDLAPYEVRAVQEETEKKMRLFMSDGKA